MPCKKPEAAVTPNKPACVRRLDFGPDKPDAFQGDVPGSLEQMLADERQRARDVWNFDFDKQIPLVGRWDWRKILVPLKVAAGEEGAEGETLEEEEMALEPEH